MGKLRDDNNFQVYGWMVNKLELKGNELLIYAIIYSFSKNNDGAGIFNASTAYLCAWTNISQRSVITCLDNLVNKKLIIKLEDNAKIRKPNVYQINSALLKKVQQTTEKTSVALLKKVQQTTEKTSVNNNIINTIDNNNINTTTTEEINEAIEYYANLNPRFTPLEIEMLSDDVRRYSLKWVKEAIKIAIKRGKFNLGYAEAILKSWKANGYKDGEGCGSQSKTGMVRQKQIGYKKLYPANKIETTEEARNKFANEQSGWD